MDTITRTTSHAAEPLAGILRGGVVLLTLVTAAVHASLGGVLFMLNAIGYATFAVALVLPGRPGAIRWLIRLGLLGFTAATIAGWVLFGARFPLAYIDKGVEAVLVVFLLLELWIEDGGPGGILDRARGLAATTGRALATRIGR